MTKSCHFLQGARPHAHTTTAHVYATSNPCYDARCSSITYLPPLRKLQLDHVPLLHLPPPHQIQLEIQYVLDKLKAYEAYYRLTDVAQQVKSYVADCVRSVISTRLLDEIYNDRDVIITVVRQRLAEIMASYGYILAAVLVKDVKPADKVFKAMNAIESYKRLR